MKTLLTKEAELPDLKKLRSDRELPIFTLVDTLAKLPILIDPTIDIDPPAFRPPSTDAQLPIRTIDRKDSALPKAAKSIPLKLPPSLSSLPTETELDRYATDPTDTELEQSTAEAIEEYPPQYNDSFTDTESPT